MALPTNGRVVLETSAGDIEIELWSKEAPKACRNFLTLAMEGYYDGVIFHRIVPDFLIQTGDRTGTGGGGESFYGEPFPDEIHPRLKFAHRGLIGCANNGNKNSNDSQFFITLDRADELNGKHTLWGRCVGDTFFNALKIGQTEVGPDERPVYPPKIKTVKILDNPFDDIVPRITAAEKRAQQRARENAQREREEAQRRKGAKKNVGLLSFGMDGGGTVDDEEPVMFKKKPIVRPDLIDDPSMSIDTPITVPEPAKPRKPKVDEKPVKAPTGGDEDVLGIREKHAKAKESVKTSRTDEIAKMEADIRKLSRRRGDDSDSEAERERAAKKPKGPSALELELAKYKNKATTGSKKNKKKDETDVLAALSNFRSKLREADDGMDVDDADASKKGEGEEGEGEGEDVDHDKAWLTHRLHFPKDNTEVNEQALDHYEVIDPRARSRQVQEDNRERKREARQAGPSNARRGGGGGGGGGSSRR